MWKILIVLGMFSQALSDDQTINAYSGSPPPAFRFDYEFSSQANGWLKFHPIPGTWPEARRRCYAEGAVLASPLTQQLKAAIIHFVVKQKFPMPITIFTGIHASFSKGDYSSIEGVHWLRMPIVWSPGEPNNYNNDESCLAMVTDSNGSMADLRCDYVLPYVCYKKFAYLTVNECGTTDPEYHLEPRTGSCYKLHERRLVWNQAYLTCIAEGGHLAVINTEEEMKVVREKYSSSKNNLAIGFQDWGERVSFMTIHGEPVENKFMVWENGEPNNTTNDRTLDKGEFCGAIKRNAKLNDMWCGIPEHFLCEKHPSSLLPLEQNRI